MKRCLFLGCLVSAVLASSYPLAAQSTAFTYQGRLLSDAGPANGSYDFTFAVFSAGAGGAPLWGTETNIGVAVTNGLFTATLDFGVNPFGGPLFLEIAARTNGGSAFATLAPRQALTATPLALFANTTSNLLGALPASHLSGTLLNSTLPPNASFSGTVQASGGFSGSGLGLSNIPYSGLSSYGSLGLFTNGLDFVLLSAPSVGGNPTYAAVADINGDGKPDVVSVNHNDNTVTVLTNGGGGVLWSNMTLPVGAGAWSVVFTNLRGPGLPDLVTANSLTNTLTIYTNNGAGVFGSNGVLVVGNSPYYVTSSDLNADGKPDLICANYGDNTVTVLTNNGDGTFTLAATMPTDLGPIPVIAADITGDGKPDIIVGNYDTNRLSIYINNGNGTFFPASASTGNGPEGVAAMDLNGDGSLDLVTANARDNTLSLLTNNGNGTFTLAATLPIGNTPRFVAALDLNGDGRPDLVSADYADNVLTVLTNDGHGNFSFAARPTLRLNPRSVVVADMNGDGRPDLVSAGSGNNTVSVLGSVLGERSTELVLPGQSGGLHLSPGETGDPNLIGGAAVNLVDGGVSGAVIAGGGSSNFLGQFSANRVSADYSSIGGGSGNWIKSGADHSVIGGGWNNTIGVNAWQSVVGGGEGNLMNGQWAFTGGGYFNTNNGLVAFIGAGDFNTASGAYSFLGEGYLNNVGGELAFLGGGYLNTIQSASDAFLGGGYNNLIGSNANLSVIVGGNGNSIGAGAGEAFIGGGVGNKVGTNATAAVIPGGYNNSVSAPYGFAAGVGAQANHSGSLVLADGQFYYFSSTTSNEFSLRAQNGVRIQSDKGIHLHPADEPLIVRDWDPFGTNAPPSKMGIGRWGLFMEPFNLVLGIPDDLPGRYFQVAKYNTNGVRSSLMTVDQAGTVFATSFNGDGSALTGLNASQITSGTVSLGQLPGGVITNTETGVTLSGAFSGDGSGLNGVNATALGGNPAGAYALLNSSPAFSGTVSGAGLVVTNAQVTGLLRSGSETGTSDTPNPAGVVVRRINNYNTTAGLILARTDNLTLERDGTAGGFVIRYPASPGYITIASMGMDNTGTQRNFYTSLANPPTAGTLQIYSNAQNVVHFECTFGITFAVAHHVTRVTLTRYTSDTYWVGDLVSTFNQ